MGEKKKKQKCILVVDDDPTTLRLMEKLLINDGYKVILASNGYNGVNMAREKQPDLILLDILLPDIDGVEVARQILSNNITAQIPIVFMTIVIKLEEDKGDQTLTVDDRTFHAFAKPIHKRKTLSVIRKEINRSHTQNISLN